MFAVYSTAPMDENHWYGPSLEHVWLPYAQMKTMRPPLPVVRTRRLPHRAGGRARTDRRHRVLVDGLSRLQSPAYPGGRGAPARTHAACDVRRAGARAGLDAGAAARGAAAGRSRPRVLQQFRIGRGRDRDEDGGAILAQPRRAIRAPSSSRSAAAIMATPPARWRSAIRTPACTRRSRACCRSIVILRFAAWRATLRCRRSCRSHGEEIAGIIVEPLVQGAGGMKFHDAAGAAAAARAGGPPWLLLIFDEIFTGFGRTGTMFACEAPAWCRTSSRCRRR